ncbi:MAG: hypothetical protein ABJP79_00330 [Tateyamaria sp.]|uniref:hypothetical protein n=1 Tax=Tateyamaria sp. TaxID=1929288 RepID=UPI00329BA2CB
MRATTLVLCLTLMGCTTFPALDGAISPELENADFPALVPVESLLARSAPVVADPIQATQALESSVSGLRARANALQRRSIIDAGTKARLLAAMK